MKKREHIIRHLGQRLFVFAAAVFACGAMERAAAQSGAVEFNSRAPLRVSEGETFRIEFVVSVEGNRQGDLDGAQFAPPDLNGIEVLAGPVPSRGVFMSTVNGVSQSRTTATFTYLVRAGSAGRIRIPEAGVTVGGKSYRSKPLTIDCVKSGAGSSPQQPGRSGGGGADETGGKSSLSADDILLRIEVNKTEVYRGEPVAATLKIYTCVPIVGFEQIKYPALNGFWAQELEVTDTEGRTETVGGKSYHGQALRQWLLYPQRSGTLEIEQAQLSAVAQLVTQLPATGSHYDLIYGGAPQIKNITAKLSSPAVKIRVKELPQPQPADFTGAVGQFEWTGGISGDRFAANTAGSFTLRLSGTGNFPLVEAPQIDLPVAFEQFDRKTTERLTHTARGTTGEKSFEYPFIARAEGDYTLPGIPFSYFDPAAGSYRRLTTPDFRIEILRDEGGGGTEGLGMISGVTKEDLRLLDSDIRFIRMGDPGLVRQGRVFLWSGGWFAAALGLAAVFAGLLVYLQKSIRERTDVVRTKTKKASKVALRRLKRAKTFMTAGREGAFFEELLRALWGYMGDKLAIEVANLTKERVQEELVVRRGVSDDEAREFLGLLAECELAQYSPAAGIQPQEAYRQALELIDKFESKL